MSRVDPTTAGTFNHSNGDFEKLTGGDGCEAGGVWIGPTYNLLGGFLPIYNSLFPPKNGGNGRLIFLSFWGKRPIFRAEMFVLGSVISGFQNHGDVIVGCCPQDLGLKKLFPFLKWPFHKWLINRRPNTSKIPTETKSGSPWRSNIPRGGGFNFVLKTLIPEEMFIWSNYSDLTRPISPKM